MTIMENISAVVLEDVETSNYIVRPIRIHFMQNGNERSWDLVSLHDSVIIIIYNVTRDKMILVKQFRPAVYVNSIPMKERVVGVPIDTRKYPAKNGITIELCSGLVDKRLPIEEVAREEVLEECGYDVPVNSIQKVASYLTGVGIVASIQSLFYCEVTDCMRVSNGGGVNSELIEVVEWDIPELLQYLSQKHIHSPPAFFHGVYWFLNHKVKHGRFFSNSRVPSKL